MLLQSLLRPVLTPLMRGMFDAPIFSSSAWSPLALWPDGIATPGMWISPRTLTSEWKDYTGTTPVVTPGTVADSSNPVGLALDIRTGAPEVLGPNVLPNGTFDTNVDNWGSVSPGATISWDAGTALLNSTTAGVKTTSYSAPILTIGKTYEIRFTVTATNAAGGNAFIGWGSGNYYRGGDRVGLETKIIVVAAGTSLVMRVDGVAYANFDNISAREVPGLHMFQSTDVDRPLLSARVNLLVGTATLSTQNVTVTAIPHTITFSGGGTVTASGTYVGALTSGQTFTPTAGTLTLTVSGSVTSAMLNRGSVALTYQPAVSASSYTATGFPTYQQYNGTNSSMATVAFSAGTLTSAMDCMIAVRRGSAASCVAGLYNGIADATKFFGMAESASGSGCVGSGAGTPTVWVDNTQLTGGTAVTRGTLHTALTVGDWHILEFRNLDLSTWTAAGFGLYTSYVFPGPRGDILLYPSTASTEDKDAARQYLADYYGVTLP